MEEIQPVDTKSSESKDRGETFQLPSAGFYD